MIETLRNKFENLTIVRIENATKCPPILNFCASLISVIQLPNIKYPN